MGTKKITFNDKTAIIPKAVHENQVWDDDVNEIKEVVNSNADQQVINTQDIDNLKNGIADYQLVSKMQSNWSVDQTGQKYAQLELVRKGLTNNIIAFGSSGLISRSDAIILQDISNTILRVTPNENYFLFYKELQTGTIDTALKLFLQQDFPLASIPGIVADGIYLKYVAYLQNGTLQFSDDSFSQDETYCQLGRIILKRVGGVTTFIDAFGTGNRNVKTIPDIAGYNDLLKLYAPLASNVKVSPNANLTMRHDGGFLTGTSINWTDANKNKKTILAQNPLQFVRLDPSLAVAIIPPTVVTNLDVTTYWNGSALVAIPSNVNATVQRILMSDSGNLVVQVGEFVYANFADAKAAFSVAPFTTILPVASYVEIGRIVAVKNTTNLSDETKCQFYVTTSGGGGGGAAAGTDISVIPSPTNAIISSSTGLDGTLGLVDGVNAGLVSPAQFASKANDSDVLHKTGNETKTGILSMTNPIGGGTYIGMIQSGSGADRYAIEATNNGAVNSSAIRINNNSSDAYGLFTQNNGAGTSIRYENNAGGTGLSGQNNATTTGTHLNNSSTGKNLVLNNTTAATGLPFSVQKNGVDKLTINDAGSVTATSLIKSGVNAGNMLLAGGADIPQSTFQPAITGLTTNYLPKWSGSGFGNSAVYCGGDFVTIGGTENLGSKLNVRGTIRNLLLTSDTGDTILSAIEGVSSAFQITKSAGNVLEYKFHIGNGSRAYTITNSGKSLFNTTIDNGVDALQVNGTILASPAVNSNQVVVKSQLDAVSRPYKVYTALLTQTGTNAPTATVLENTLGGTVVWTRSSTGLYYAALAGVFIVLKTSLLLTNGDAIGPGSFVGSRLNDNTIFIQSLNTSGAVVDATLRNATVEIRVYN